MSRITPEILLCAYASGLFPMANDRHDPTIHWIEPRRRGILPLDRFHQPKSLKKLIRQGRYRVTTDTAFEDVIVACGQPRHERPRTWLNDELIRLYCQLFEVGHAHSVETWEGDRLVGGLYGVSLGSAFFGESMFTHQRDASKVALVTLVERLAQGDYVLLDTQFITDHLRRFGAIEIPQDQYRRRLRPALARPAVFYSDGGPVPSRSPWAASDVITPSQPTTQMS